MPSIMDRFAELLFGKPTATADPPAPVAPSFDPVSITGIIDPLRWKVLVITHAPRMPDGRLIGAVYGWQQPADLLQGCIDDLREVSYGYWKIEITEHLTVDAFPVKKDGFRYTPASFEQAWKTRQFHQPDAVDYLALVEEFDLIGRVNRGEIDEVWLMGFPYCGYYESIMAGPKATWCNAPPLQGTERADRRFVIMGYNYERGVGEMLENFGHRAESMLAQVYKGRTGEANLWEKFIRYDRKFPGQAECGNVHFAPNSLKDYDWGNRTPVPSRADTWLNFPDLGGAPRIMTCADWGDGDIRAHHRWWFRHLPHHPGTVDGIAGHWWRYVADVNHVP